MTTEIELNDLSNSGKNREESTIESRNRVEPGGDTNDSVVSYWTWVAASTLLVLSLFLSLVPGVILFASSVQESRAALTPLETYLTLHFGIWLSAISVALVLNIPHALPIPSHTQKPAQTHPLLIPVTGASLLTCFLSYNTYDVGFLASIVFLLTGAIGLWGLWEIVFSGSASISKSGLDKRTSAFIFGNKSAASVQKKQQRKGQGGKL